MLVRSQVTSGGLHLPSSAQLRAAGGVYCTYCSLYILIMLTYRVAMAQAKQALFAGCSGLFNLSNSFHPSSMACVTKTAMPAYTNIKTDYPKKNSIP